jgi:hypothetical protein
MAAKIGGREQTARSKQQAASSKRQTANGKEEMATRISFKTFKKFEENRRQ